jgi:hypothetical protein
MGEVFAGIFDPYGRMQLMAMARTRPMEVVDAALSVPAEKVKPEPMVTADTAVPLPCSKPVILVDIVRIGVDPPLLVPAKPFAVATDTDVTPVAAAGVLVQVVPFDVNTLPDVPGATT